MKKAYLYLLITLLVSVIFAVGCDSGNKDTSKLQSKNETTATDNTESTIITTTITTMITTSTTTTTTIATNSSSGYIEYYNKIKNLSIYDCNVDLLGSYSYNGITIPEKDISKKGKIEQIAFYDGLAMCLDFFELGNSWEKYSKHIIGYTPNSKSDFAESVDELKKFIINNDSFYNIFKALYKKFKEIESVKITNNDNIYNITVNDIKKCSHDLNISDEMFAYIIGAFHVGGAEIDLKTNSCSIIWKDYSNKISLD